MKSIQAATYPVHFEEKAYNELALIIKNRGYSSIFILVDENTYEHCYTRFMQLLQTDNPIEIIQIDSGEINKNMDTCIGVWNAMTELGADRKSLLITLGGGVITDLGGFVASTFKRGIEFINIPTTLLSMVDASVGGKTGVDLGVLKNQIGVFANPEMIVIDPEYLHTVTPREIRSGTAEIIKYGMTHDIRLFNEIKDNPNLNIIDLIHRSIEIKNEVVLEDPKEKSIRKVLNWGHTIGHGVESYFLDSKTKENLTHGEAIAIGMVCEAYISSKILNFPEEHIHEIKSAIIAIYGKTSINKEDTDYIIDLMKHDKKNVGGEINFVLLENYENFKIDCKVPNDLIKESLQFYNS
ncbi:3-dehydroquinate synthase [Tenacibaculum sp. MAR_2009_124]|uniref:3-dehydroquinate synthase n=1 Tax=Tenacibaculum sp. MAR_2009_124 TaxID=1250059 RepID=UPI0008989B42|nr:3-dehydroquinate synthase [Tenacibaculum sp. MAR_2009_124]SEB39691.1 3-dehydroquinate synthase [Tenacibaculum sp. MAR_2009_124]